jgi:2-polyprenyl-6-hydroxyphenyl methylase/3-demethylubiquinone-9 3-methyltransferase
LCHHFGRDARLPRPLAGLAVLDVGCGGGLVAEPLCRLGATVTGIDAEARSIGIARAHAQAVGLDVSYRRALPETLAAEGRRFHAVVAMEVVEHVADVDGFVAACSALLQDDGMVVAATLNRTLKALALAKIGAEYVLRWLPVGTHDWRKFLRPAELAAVLRRHRLEPVDVAGMTYTLVLDRWTLTSDLDVNYLMAARRR